MKQNIYKLFLSSALSIWICTHLGFISVVISRQNRCFQAIVSSPEAAGRVAEQSGVVGHRLEGQGFESRQGHGCGF